MDLLKKIDLMTDTTVAGDVATNTSKGDIDVVGGKCPDGQVYDRIKKVCVLKKNESTTVGATYISGNSTIAGSRQTRVCFTTKREILDLARKEPVTDKKDDPTETNILGRKGLKFDKKSGAYVPELWEE